MQMAPMTTKPCCRGSSASPLENHPPNRSGIRQQEAGLKSAYAVASWLRHSDAARVVNAAREHASPAARLDALVRENVVAQLANIRTHPSVALALAQSRLNLHGWVYEIAAGSIDALDGTTNRFVPLSENLDTCAVRTHSREERRVRSVPTVV
jgi:hypothetical protein